MAVMTTSIIPVFLLQYFGSACQPPAGLQTAAKSSASHQAMVVLARKVQGYIECQGARRLVTQECNQIGFFSKAWPLLLLICRISASAETDLLESLPQPYCRCHMPSAVQLEIRQGCSSGYWLSTAGADGAPKERFRWQCLWGAQAPPPLHITMYQPPLQNLAA